MTCSFCKAEMDGSLVMLITSHARDVKGWRTCPFACRAAICENCIEGAWKQVLGLRKPRQHHVVLGGNPSRRSRSGLEPCPFCGEEHGDDPYSNDSDHCWYVMCDRCQTTGPVGRTKMEAGRRWNRVRKR